MFLCNLAVMGVQPAVYRLGWAGRELELETKVHEVVEMKLGCRHKDNKGQWL